MDSVDIASAVTCAVRDVADRLDEAVAADAGSVDAVAVVIDAERSDTAEFAEAYDVPLARCANCIVTVSGRGENARTAMALVPATHRLVTKTIQRELGGKTSFAKPEVAAAATGMEFGAITPMGRPRDIPVFVASELMRQDWVIIGGGVRDIKFAVAPSAIVEALGGILMDGLATDSVPS